MVLRSRRNPQALELIKKNGVKRICVSKKIFHILGIQETSSEIAKDVLEILMQFYPDIAVVWETGASFRSQNGVNVQQIVMDLGGGGKVNSAGFAMRNNK